MKVSLEKRSTAVKEHLEEGKSYRYLGEKYGVGRHTVST